MAETEYNQQGITQGLDTNFIGRALQQYSEVSSTMDLAKEWVRQKAPEGATVVADHQTSGRGRLQRQWQAPPGTSLLLSVVFYPPPALVTSLTMLGCLAISHAVEETTGLDTAIKWPNDVIINGKKVCGVMVESEVHPDGSISAIMGIGLNVNFDPALLSDVIYPATTLSAELGQEAPRVTLLQNLLRSLERLYVSAKGSQPIHEEWRRRLDTLGKRVKVTLGDHTEEGIAEDVNHDGSLVLRRLNGTFTTIIAGDVTLRT